MIGKFLLGPLTDRLGGDSTMQITMFAISALLYGCAVSTNIQVTYNRADIANIVICIVESPPNLSVRGPRRNFPII